MGNESSSMPGDDNITSFSDSNTLAQGKGQQYTQNKNSSGNMNATASGLSQQQQQSISKGNGKGTGMLRSAGSKISKIPEAEQNSHQHQMQHNSFNRTDSGISTNTSKSQRSLVLQNKFQSQQETNNTAHGNGFHHTYNAEPQRGYQKQPQHIWHDQPQEQHIPVPSHPQQQHAHTSQYTYPPMPPQLDGKLIDIMFASESINNTNIMPQKPKHVKKSSKMGKLVEKMGLLSTSGKSNNNNNNQRPLSTMKSDEDEWQHAWEEDSDSDDDGEIDEDDTFSASATITHNSMNLQGPMQPSHSNLLPPPPPMVTLPAPNPLLQQTPSLQQNKGVDDTSQSQQLIDQFLGGGETRWDTDNPDNSYQRPNLSMFNRLRVLGKGSFGKVSLVQKNCGLDKGNLFAMKVLKKTHLQKRGQIERTKTERKVLSLVNHPFIMKLHFAFQTDDKLFLVLDYCAGGELFFHLSRHRQFSEKYARFYAAELLLALGHLHSHGIIFRDLKPENVLFDADGHVKLGDFGLAKDNIRHPYKGAKSICGTPEYMAPEILQQCGHGFCVDYWGLGMLVYEMLTGLPPWYTTDRQTLYRRLKSAPLDIPPYFSPQASSFVYALLQRDPRRRLGVQGPISVMSHDFFRGLDFREIMNKRYECPIRPCEGWKSRDASRSSSFNGSYRSTQNNESSSPSIHPDDLDIATANFDHQFTRMAVSSSDKNDGNDSDDDRQDLNSTTFLGFTFDELDHANNTF